jgi:hypothetical protein
VRTDPTEQAELATAFNGHLRRDGWELVEDLVIDGRPTYVPERKMHGLGTSVQRIKAVAASLNSDSLYEDLRRLERILDTITWARPGQAKAFTQEHFVRKKLQKGQLSEQEADALLASLDGRKTPQLRSESELVMLARKPLNGSLEHNVAHYGVGDIHGHAEEWAGAPASNVVRTGAKRSGKDKTNMHMTVKPVDLIAHLIRLCTREGQVVLDPFLGSGSHGVSAVMEGRSFIGFEMVDEYYQLSGDRISKAAQGYQNSAPPAVMGQAAA